MKTPISLIVAGLGFSLAAQASAQVAAPDYTEFSHFIPQRFGAIFASYSTLNGKWVSTAVHARSDPYRYRFMPVEWKAENPEYDPLTKWFSRTPNWVVVGVPVLTDLGIRTYHGVKTEQDFHCGMIATEEDREIAHARNIGGFVGGWTGAWVGGTVGGTIGTAVEPGPGTAVGTIAGGAGGYYLGDKSGEYLAEHGTRAFIHEFGTIADAKDKVEAQGEYYVNVAQTDARVAIATTENQIGVAKDATCRWTANSSSYVAAKSIAGWTGTKNVAANLKDDALTWMRRL